MRILAFLSFVGCTPHLKSDQEVISGENWEAPDNDWSVSEPPSNLVAEGFSAGDTPYDFRLIDQFGNEVSLWQFYGSVILLDISTMWCGPCQHIAQDVNETWLDYKDDEFMYITVLPEDLEGGTVDAEDLAAWSDGYGIEAPVLADNEGYGYMVEPDKAWPVVMLIDRKMKVAIERIPAEDSAIRDAIEGAL